MNEISAKIAEIRRSREVSQAELAKRVGVSQGTISRLETAEEAPRDIRLLSQVAKALNEPLANLIPEEMRSALLPAINSASFYAFCPNPFCPENRIDYKEEGASVFWRSGASHAQELFDDTNFCAGCGTELVKECPSCKRRLEGAGCKFCVRCGTKIYSRPTTEEWQRITKTLESKKPKLPEQFKEEDIPF